MQLDDNKIFIFDTTLRDGAQSANISFSVRDKLHIIEKLDEVGIDYIEVGFPSSNPKDLELFDLLKNQKRQHAKIVAFGRTRYKNTDVESDGNLKSLLDSGADTICIFGKSSALHVEKVIETSLDNNLDMINSSIRYLKGRHEEIIFDAEHFFDGYKYDAEYALKTLEAADSAGADFIVLCDTNGGTLPHEIEDILTEVGKRVKGALGVHYHNDSGCAVANSILSVGSLAKVRMVQGTINGYGERCGNADLCQIIPSLEIKLGKECLPASRLRQLTGLSRYVGEVANQHPDPHQPYVGQNAFAHKGGMHVSGVSKISRAFEHISPDMVGNNRDILISELSGKKSIILKADEFGIDLKKEPENVTRILDIIQNLEHKGFQFEAADGSFELIIRDVLGQKEKFFTLESFRVLNERTKDRKMISEATVKVYVNDKRIIETAEGNGPVNALDCALRKALGSCYPDLRDIKLTDFKVRVLDEKKGTGAVVRVLIESSDGEKTWNTIGVSENIIEASWDALEDSIVFGLMHLKRNNK